MLSCRPHLDIDVWLRKLDLEKYFSIFEKYNGVEDMLHLTEKELKTMGIKNGSHRARIASSLHILKEKYHRAFNGHSPNASMTSLKSDAAAAGLRSLDSVSPVSHSEVTSAGVRSWPCSGASSLIHTRNSSHRSSMEKIDVEASADELKKALERELSLDGSDLRSYAWYHGTILRLRAEDLMRRDGDFLVRDCISQPGDFVITCRWGGLPLHFIIKKVILHPHTVYEKIQYTFEGDSFDSIPDFITYYVGSRCPLSSTSGAIISCPINRCMPLSYYETRFGVQCQVHYAAKALEKVPQKEEDEESNSDVDGVPNVISSTKLSEIHKIPMPKTPDSSCTFERVDSESKNMQNGTTIAHHKPIVKVGSDPNLNMRVEKRAFENRPNSGTFTSDAVSLIAECNHAPPKPSRVPSKRLSQRPLVVKRERKNTPPTPLLGVSMSVFDEFSEHGAPIPVKRMVSGETRFSFLDHPSVSSEGSLSEADSISSVHVVPSVPGVSCLRPAKFRSPLISTDNKPLEVDVLNRVKELLLQESSKTLACHLTHIDLEISKNFGDEDLGFGVTSGLELVLLPQGQQLVKDLLERTSCLKLFVEVTILTCSAEEERVQMLQKWIEIAIDTKNTLGNFFSFTAIMLGLTASEILCLNSMWLLLRQTFTNIAFTFETKLRPALKAMQDATMQIAPNTCFPYVLSLLKTLDHHLKVMQELSINGGYIQEDETTFGIPGEKNSGDYGLQGLVEHLEAGRSLFTQSTIFQSNSNMALREIKFDNLLLDIFRTEFQMRMLWGFRGSLVNYVERYEKFDKILDVLSKRCLNLG